MNILRTALEAAGAIRNVSYAAPATLAAVSSAQMQKIGAAAKAALTFSLSPSGKHVGQWLSLAVAAQAVASLTLGAWRVQQNRGNFDSSVALRDLASCASGVLCYSSPLAGIAGPAILLYVQSQQDDFEENLFKGWLLEPYMKGLCARARPLNEKIGQHGTAAALICAVVAGLALCNLGTRSNLGLAAISATVIAAGAGKATDF